MSSVDRPEAICQMLIGAGLAFMTCRFMWGVEHAGFAANICIVGAVASFLWARHLRKKKSSP